MSAVLNFDASTVAPDTGAQDALPAGWYDVMMEASEMKPTKDTTGAYLECKFNVLAPAHSAGKKIFARLNLRNANPTAQEIGYKQLSAICHATRVLQVADSAQLHNIPLKLKLKVRKPDGDYEASNEVTAYKNINEVVTLAAAPGAPATGAFPAAAPAAPGFQMPPQAAPGFPTAAAPAAPGFPQAPMAPQAPAAAPAAQWQPPAAQQPWQAPAAAPAPMPTQMPQQQPVYQQPQAPQQPVYQPPVQQQPMQQPPQMQQPVQQAPVAPNPATAQAQTATPPWMTPPAQ